MPSNVPARNDHPYNFNASVGVEKYFIPGLVGIDTLVFYIQNVRYSMQFEKRNLYFGSPRVQNINSLPFEWYFERAIGGGNLYIYFLLRVNLHERLIHKH